MAHYAFIDDNNLVTEVIVGRDEEEIVDGVSDWETYYSDIRGQRCLRTSYNTVGGVHSKGGEAFRFNYAAIGFTFDPDKGTDGAFIPPKPYDSWVLNEDTCLWDAPVPYPTDGAVYTWDEDAVNWVEVTDV